MAFLLFMTIFYLMRFFPIFVICQPNVMLNMKYDLYCVVASKGKQSFGINNIFKKSFLFYYSLFLLGSRVLSPKENDMFLSLLFRYVIDGFLFI